VTDRSTQFAWQDWLIIAAASAFALVIGGYCFGREDHSTYLPMMWAIQSPDLFKGDLLLESAPHMHMLFWQVMARITQLLPEQPTFFVVHLLIVVCTCIATFGAARAIFEDRAAAGLALALLVAPKGLFGLVEAGINSQPLLTQTNVAVCLLTFAIWQFMRNRYIAAFLLVGFAFNAQGMTATFVLCMFAMFLIGARRIFGWKRIGQYFAAFAVAAFPTILQIVRMLPDSEPATLAAVDRWIEIMHVRMAHHVFPLSWHWSVWLRGVLLIACFVTAFLAKERKAADVKVIGFAGAIVFMCAVGVGFGHFFPLLPVMQFQLFRSTRFVMLLGLLYLAADCVKRRSGNEGMGSAAAIAGVLTFPKGAALTAPLLILYLSTRVRRAPLVLRCAAVVWLHAALALPAARRMESGVEGVAAGACWALFLAFAVVLVVFARGTITAKRRDQWLCLVLSAFMLVLAGGRLARNHGRWGQVTLNPLPNDRPWIDVQTWCRDHTEPGQSFLVPIYLDSFRCFSQRPIVGDFKDAGPHMYSLQTLSEWDRRMTDMGLWKRGDPKRAYIGLSAYLLRLIALKYGAQYVVVEKEHSVAGEPLYKNQQFAVYSVGGQR